MPQDSDAITDVELDAAIDAVLQEFAAEVAKFRKERDRAINMLMGQAMKKERRLNPELTKWIIRAKLENPYFKIAEVPK